jgi:predicted lactoylglutathione lyase
MSPTMYLNLPVRDLEASIDFFAKIGFSSVPEFTNEQAGCVALGDNVYAMLVTHDFFKTAARRELADTAATSEALFALQVESTERVDQITDAAVAAGGRGRVNEDADDFMYSRSFEDLDGHIWSILFMDLPSND